ncbi:MAG: bacteriohemerythrin [Prochlorothrix sp.]
MKIDKIAQWRPQYETGDPVVDSQHQNLFSMINGLHRAMLEGQGEQLLAKTLDGLQDYTAIHFETEEHFMCTHHYPHYETHKKRHDMFKSRIASLSQSYTQGSRTIAEITREVSHLLTHWFIHHIKHEDQRMIDFCTGRQSASSVLDKPESEDFSREDGPIAPPQEQQLAHWHPRYETGYVLIDDQHKALFHAINALHGAILEGRTTPELVHRTLKSLHNYTTIHFETEEQFMLKTHYPDYEAHHEKHLELRARVEALNVLERDGDSRALSITMSHFLTDWLISHINGEDQKMIKFLRKERQARLT